MKLYDISQEVFSCAVYPGDPSPQRDILSSMDSGALYNLTAFSMCAHNGTHIDAPVHFIQAGQTVDQLPLSKTVGYAYVTKHHGAVTADDARAILASAEKLHPDAAKRILIGGDSLVTLEAAQVFADAKIDLLGNESQTVGPEDAPMAVHQVLLGAEIVLLEGIRLADVPEGVYLLFTAPLLLGGADGAPCRAILAEL
jgi:arylformamidase